jgi:hypothetical protein
LITAVPVVAAPGATQLAVSMSLAHDPRQRVGVLRR